MKPLALLFVLMAGIALAQPPRAYFPWWESRFSEGIGLTEEQKGEIRDIQKKYRNLMIDERANVEKAEGNLSDLFSEDEIDDAATRAAVDRLVAARGEMTRLLTEMSVELRKVLTTGQWRALEQRRSERRPSRRFDQRMRRGGPAPSPEGPPPHPDGPPPGEAKQL